MQTNEYKPSRETLRAHLVSREGGQREGGQVLNVGEKGVITQVILMI